MHRGVALNYVITGGAGFIGSHYVRMLLTNEFGQVDSVKVIDKLTYAGKIENLSQVLPDPRLEFFKGDICDPLLVRSVISPGDIVLNFAAESHVDNSIMDSTEFIKTNVLGTQVLLTSAKENLVKTFIQVSTDEVYGSVPEGSSVETDALEPNSPYSASKAAADLLVRSFVVTHGLDARITRCCNNYGENQFPEKLIPLAVENLKQGKKVPVYGDGKNIREWISVGRHCRGINEVLQKGLKGEIYNIGSGFLLTNLELLEIVTQSFGLDLTNSIEYVRDRKGHDYRYSLDTSKLEQLSALEFLSEESEEVAFRKFIESQL